MSEVMIQGQLPAGAILGGLLHLGGGVFVGHAFPPSTDAESTRALGCFPMVIEGQWAAPMSPMPTQVYTAPLSNERRCILATWPGLATETDFAASVGLSYEELMRRHDADKPA